MNTPIAPIVPTHKTAKTRYAELMEFNRNWDNYSIDERDKILKDFQKAFNPPEPISF